MWNINVKHKVTMETIERLNNMPMLIDGLIPKGHVVTLVADSGVGKTLAALAFAREIVEVNPQMDVVLFDFEDGKTRGSDMIGLAIKALGDKISIVEADHCRAAYKTLDDQDDLSNTIVIIDSLQAFHAAMVIQGDLDKPGVAVKVFKEIKNARAKGATVFVIHHANKMDKTANHTIDKMQYRGSGGIKADSDTMIYLMEADSTLTKKTGTFFEANDLNSINLQTYLEKQSFSKAERNGILSINRDELKIVSKIDITENVIKIALDLNNNREDKDKVLAYIVDNQNVSSMVLRDWIIENLDSNGKKAGKLLKELVDSKEVAKVISGKSRLYTTGSYDV